MNSRIGPRLARSVAPLLATALALAGCDRTPESTAAADTAAALPDLPATLPLATDPATRTAFAPSPSELPDVRAIPAVRTASPDDAYAYADQAYGFADALGDAPPDYAFDYDGVDPWAWQGYDDSLSFAEPIDGGYRYYYYRPGAETPYYIRDPRYGYGYADGRLAVVYAMDGTIVPYESYGPQLGYASRYWVRGRDLWRASRTHTRRPVIAANWQARRPIIADSRSRWLGVRQRQPQWVAYHARSAQPQGQHWRPEQVRRQADTRRYAAWQDQGFRTPPPPRAIPAKWRQAAWAQDPRRFAPAQAPGRRVAERRREPETPASGAPGREARLGRPQQATPDQRQRRADRPDVPGVTQQRAARQAERRATMQVENTPQRTQAGRERDRQPSAQPRPAVREQRRDANREQRQAQRAEPLRQQARAAQRSRPVDVVGQPAPQQRPRELRREMRGPDRAAQRQARAAQPPQQARGPDRGQSTRQQPQDRPLGGGGGGGRGDRGGPRGR